MDSVRKGLLVYYKPWIVRRPEKYTGIFPKKNN